MPVTIEKYSRPRGLKAEDGWILKPNIVSVDPGNGKWSAFYADSGNVYSVNIPHGRVPVTGDRLDDIPGVAQADITYVDWNGTRYGVGEGVWNYATRYPVETFQGSELRYGSDLHIMAIIATIALLRVPSSEPLFLIVPVPPGLMSTVLQATGETVRDRVQHVLTNGEKGDGSGTWTIAINEGKAITYTLKRVIVIPEGLGGYAAYRWTLQGEEIKLMSEDNTRDLLAGRVVIGDLGLGTADKLVLFKGEIAPEELQHATDEDGGLYTHMIQPILDIIVSETGLRHLRAPHIDEWLRRWAKSRYAPDSAKVVVGNYQIELHDTFVRLQNKYADYVLQTLIEPERRKGANAFAEVGGGWLFIENKIRSSYPKFPFLTPLEWQHVRNVPLFELNGYGGLPFAANNIRVHKK